MASRRQTVSAPKKARITSPHARAARALGKLMRERQDAFDTFMAPVSAQSRMAVLNAPGGGPDLPPMDFTTYCPHCRRIMSMDEVTQGFSSSVLDPTTECPDCNHRFITSATIDLAKDERQRFTWYCPAQTRDQYAEWIELRRFWEQDDVVAILAEDRPDIAWNAFVYSKYGKDSLLSVKEAIAEFLQQD